MNDIYKLTMKNTAENISLARLNVSFVANKLGFNIEEIEDIKVSVSEALNYQLNLSEKTEIEFILKDNVIEIFVYNNKLEENENLNNESNKFAKMILETLMDSVIFEKDRIYLSKKLQG